MSKSLTFEEMSTSIAAANQLRNKFGQEFTAMICKTRYHKKEFVHDEKVFIGHGRYSDANMPYIAFGGCNYDCAYVKMRYNDGCLTIYLNDMEIDILPKENDQE